MQLICTDLNKRKLIVVSIRQCRWDKNGAWGDNDCHLELKDVLRGIDDFLIERTQEAGVGYECAMPLLCRNCDEISFYCTYLETLDGNNERLIEVEKRASCEICKSTSVQEMSKLCGGCKSALGDQCRCLMADDGYGVFYCGGVICSSCLPMAEKCNECKAWVSKDCEFHTETHFKIDSDDEEV